MSFAETVALGALAGFTIYLGLPFGRLDLVSDRARVALAMFAVGVLAFLFVDVFEHAFAIVEEPVKGFRDGEQGIGEAIGLTALLGVGFAAGTAGLGMIERRLRARGTALPPIAGGSGELTVEDAARLEHEALAARARALRTGMTIAAAIGLHNFAEGLAIGVSAMHPPAQLLAQLAVLQRARPTDQAPDRAGTARRTRASTLSVLHASGATPRTSRACAICTRQPAAAS